MSVHLSQGQLQQLRELLESERRRILGRHTESLEEVDREPQDTLDDATQEVSRRDELALSDHDRAHFFEIEAALRRMADGSYGLCEETDEPIPFARLLAQPTTRFTVEAQESVEDEAAREGLTSPTDDDSSY